MKQRNDSSTVKRWRAGSLKLLAVLCAAYCALSAALLIGLLMQPEFARHTTLVVLPSVALIGLSAYVALALYRAARRLGDNWAEGVPPNRDLGLDDSILNRLSDGILAVRPDGKVTFANRGAAAMFDSSLESLLGAPIGELLPVPFGGVVSPESIKSIVESLCEADSEGRHPRVFGLRRDGRSFPVELSIGPPASGTANGFVLTARDVSERRKADNLATRLGRLLDGAGEEVYIFDDQSLHFSDVNARALSNLGHTRQRLLRSKPTDLAPSLPTQTFDDMLAKLRSGEEEHLTYQTVHQRADGSEYPVEVTLSYSRDEDPPVFMAIAEDISVRRNAEARLEFIAHHDPLTELPNRMLFMDRLEQALLNADRTGECVTLMFADLDLFKRVNDTLGHDTGDALLTAVGRRMQQQVRASDTVARLAGDEFTVLLVGTHDRTDAERVAAKILRAFEAPIRIGDHDIVIGMSIGVTLYPMDQGAPVELLHHADEAMYAVKKAGRGAFQVYEPELVSAAERRQRTEHALRNAIALDDLEISLQPVVDVGSQMVIGGLAGVHWETPDGETIDTDGVLNCAQQIGMLENIELWLMRSACAEYARWAAAMDNPPDVFVGLSTWQLRRRDFTSQVEELLSRYSVPPEGLVIGLMEGGLLDVLEGVTAGFDVLKALGVRFNVIDFGSGYQRLGRMQNFPVDFLSLPPDLIAKLPDDVARNTVEPLVVTGGSLRARVIAPKVDTAAARESLMSLGCEVMHGDAVAPATDADAFLRSIGDKKNRLRLVSSHGADTA